MSERYIRLFSLTNNLYIDNAPVVVAAGALLKDTKTDKILVQLKIKNIGKKKIKAATVKIDLQDTAGRIIGDTIEHQYLDLAVKTNDYFGEQEPIIIAEQNARAYSASVSEIVFEDNSLWNCENKNWEEKIKLIPLSEKLQYIELIKQYQNSLFGLAEVKYVPYQENDLWVCTCGNINRIEQEKCLSCGNTLISLQENLDEEKLREAVNNRLLAEREKAEAEQKKKEEKTKPKNNKTILLAGIISVIVLACIGIFMFMSEPIVGQWEGYAMHNINTDRWIFLDEDEKAETTIKFNSNKTFKLTVRGESVAGKWKALKNEGDKYTNYSLSTDEANSSLLGVASLDDETIAVYFYLMDNWELYFKE